MKTIFSILDSPFWGGAENYVVSNLFHLFKSGYKVILATNNSTVKRRIRELLSDQKNRDNFKIVDYSFKIDIIGNWKGLAKTFFYTPLALIWLNKQLRKLDKKNKLICIFPGFSERLLLTPLAKKYANQIVWLEFGPLTPIFKKKIFLPKMMYQFSEKFVDKLITISQYSRKSILKESHFTQSKIALIPPGIEELSSLKKKRLKKIGHNWLKQHKLNRNFLFTTVGRLADEKQFDLLIKAFANVKQNKNINSKLLIIGDGPCKRNLKKMVGRLKLKQDIIFSDFVSEELKMALLIQSDVFIFPGAWDLEGFGMTTVEALLAGLAVITSGFGPQKEIVQNQVDGLHFKVNDANDLSRKMSLLYQDKAVRKNLSKQGFKKSLEKFTQSQMNDTFYQLIEGLC